ncbi:chemotaxis protein CheW [Salipiger mucosus]|uniref:Positive regulator of CheA protein activity (CheW) n=1 Tax=Salipiger mucosus DSM 16094 TaxID=1123237 RepID=S9QDH8_9RHOB|nr:chemotaxis protein CheW [Salipiger mucosus]EPX77977.1 Positive regulator of CheA protein activity (CheW) [Salipiger mucosus DSM 16094]
MTTDSARMHDTRPHLMFEVADNVVAVSINHVKDVLFEARVTKVPLASKEVYGVLNLRGRIVTAISSRAILKMAPRDPGDDFTAIVVEYHGEDYAVIVDKVIETVDLPDIEREETPRTMDPHWRRMLSGIYKIEDRLLPILDLDQMFSFLDDGIIQVS